MKVDLGLILRGRVWEVEVVVEVVGVGVEEGEEVDYSVFVVGIGDCV